MPQLVSAAVDEIWNAPNMAFELCPMLTAGAIEAIELNGSEDLKRTYLPKMVAGEWTGTMNLTEPQAGSDLAAVRTTAVRHADGSTKRPCSCRRPALTPDSDSLRTGIKVMADVQAHFRTPNALSNPEGLAFFTGRAELRE